MLKVLIVHSDAKICETLARQVKYALRLKTDTCSSMSEVAQLLGEANEQYFLAVVDLSLPEASSGDLLELIKSKRIPILAVTGEVSDGIREFVVSSGLLDYAVIRDAHDIYYIVSFVERLYKNRSVKVLVIDDSPTSMMLTTHILSNFGFQLFEAESGARALKVFAANPDIRLIITDYVMADMDGVDIIRAIRRDFGKSLEEVAIIGVSAYGSSVLAARFLKNGANELLTKPFLREEFICRIHQNLAFLDNYQTMKRMAEVDHLTGLSNRRGFLERAERAFEDSLRDGNPLAVAMVDLDNFKSINDSYGHSAGDAILKAFGRLLGDAFRSVDIVGRIGGEEFGVVAVGMRPEAVPTIFEGVRSRCERMSVEFGERRLALTVSIGVATGWRESLEETIKAADALLYRAKSEGRNRVVIEANDIAHAVIKDAREKTAPVFN